MEINQPAENYQHITRSEDNAASGLQIPYDEAPFEATLVAGEKIKLYGSIEVENDTQEPCYVLVRFDLRKGFILTVEGVYTPVAFETPVMMHSKHAVKIVDGEWELVSRNTPIQK
jgi:hypothetical protein